MTTGSLVVVGVLAALLVAALGYVFWRLRRAPNSAQASPLGSPFQSVDLAEGETTRLLSGTELEGLYLPKSEYLSKAEQTLYLILRAALPQHHVSPRARLGDIVQVKIGPQGMERLKIFRKAANLPVSFVVCDKNWQIVAAVDLRDPDLTSEPRARKLEMIKERCVQAARLRYITVEPSNMPRYPQLRAQVLGDWPDQLADVASDL